MSRFATLVSRAPALFVAAALVAASPAAALAAPVTLDFEGLADGATVGTYYPGIAFTGAVARIDSDAGGSGDFGGERSPSTAIGPPTVGTILVSVPDGFTTGFAFAYANPGGSTNVRVFATPDASGPWLLDALFAATPTAGAPDPTGRASPFLGAGAAFVGTARSLQIFSRGPGAWFLDDLTLGAATLPPRAVPEPATAALLATGLLLLAGRRGRR
jgi:hypothetical protein